MTKAELRRAALKGGLTNKERRMADDPNYFKRIGAMGGAASKGKKKMRKPRPEERPGVITQTRAQALEALDG